MDEKVRAHLYNRLNEALMRYDACQNVHTHPQSHLGLTPYFMQIRQEIFCLGVMNLQKRKQRLRKLLISDYLQEAAELREIDLAFINTQP